MEVEILLVDADTRGADDHEYREKDAERDEDQKNMPYGYMKRHDRGGCLQTVHRR